MKPRARAALSCINAADRQARNPLTGQILGPNSVLAMGRSFELGHHLHQGLIQAGTESLIRRTQPWGSRPVGIAYDVTETDVRIRGGGGMFTTGRPATPFSARPTTHYPGIPPASATPLHRSGQVDWRLSRRRRCRSTSMTVRCRPRSSGTAACKSRFRGPLWSMCRLSASTATTSSRWFSTRTWDRVLPQWGSDEGSVHTWRHLGG